MEQSGGGAVVGEGGELDGCFGAIGDFHEGTFAAHVGFDPAGVGGVDFDFCIPEGIGEVNGVGVECGFAGIIGRPFEVVSRGARLGVVGEGTEDAAEVDNSGSGGFFEKRYQGLSELYEAEEIGFKSIAVPLDGDVFYSVFGGVEVDSGVVDQDIEVGEFLG